MPISITLTCQVCQKGITEINEDVFYGGCDGSSNLDGQPMITKSLSKVLQLS